MKAYRICRILTFMDNTQLLEERGTLPPLLPTTKIHQCATGETLWSISNIYYKNHENWVVIYLANGLIDPLQDLTGLDLIIPPLNG